mmetsp:Transcript_5561/g.17975  ORF Transcript_5561/g.17975 Transcript_5561/m.17975 type:complete len:119 (+) Transcript_5561:572-928(+)
MGACGAAANSVSETRGAGFRWGEWTRLPGERGPALGESMLECPTGGRSCGECGPLDMESVLRNVTGERQRGERGRFGELVLRSAAGEQPKGDWAVGRACGERRCGDCESVFERAVGGR